MENQKTTIQFLGTSSAIPDVGGDTASLIINQRYLVDTGWSVVGNLRSRGIDPLQIEYLFFTHLHHDHYLGLPQLLFYWSMQRRPLQELRIIGPALDLDRIVRRSMSFLQMDRFFDGRGTPTIIPLLPGDSYEDPRFTLTTCGTIHPVLGLCYRFEDQLSGRVIGISGDTAYHPPIAQHVRGADLLVHECALGSAAGDPETNSSLHSGAVDAARIASAAEVDRLLLVHRPRTDGPACVNAAREIFPATFDWPTDGQSIVLDSKATTINY
ncbi:MAG: MBL fold metallo-hydrolase [Herpetosiphon sp.]